MLNLHPRQISDAALDVHSKALVDAEVHRAVCRATRAASTDRPAVTQRLAEAMNRLGCGRVLAATDGAAR